MFQILLKIFLFLHIFRVLLKNVHFACSSSLYKQDGGTRPAIYCGWHVRIHQAAINGALKRAISLNYFNDVCSPALWRNSVLVTS